MLGIKNTIVISLRFRLRVPCQQGLILLPSKISLSSNVEGLRDSEDSYRLHGPRLQSTLDELHGFFIIQEAHVPKFIVVNGNNLDVFLSWI